MATEAATRTAPAPKKPPSYSLPGFRSPTWSDGIYDAEHGLLITNSLAISEESLLTFDQRVEVETRRVVYKYQVKYAEKEFEMLKEEYLKLEEQLMTVKLDEEKQQPAETEAEFKKPDVPAGKPTKAGTKRTSSSEGSVSDAASLDSSTEVPSGPKKTRSGKGTEKTPKDSAGSGKGAARKSSRLQKSSEK